MEIVNFKAEHLLQVQAQAQQQYLAEYYTPELALMVEQTGTGFSGIEDGTVVGCAGILPQWEGRALCWAYFSHHLMGNSFLKVHRAISDFIYKCDVRRLEMTVDIEFEAAHRWAEMLGFHCECPRMEAYKPDGKDVALYVRIKR